ncbi:hypothetical protein BO78DRAFT_399435 [Aspergillus sclerotiicarbonarius CBS 121057]|uniref:Uncharacterized protein n=1 Tax=Aspergillus sclerotiicarbonarius (strain CBS 121057 / IBT 28362) TaxID=1448318 RepID=A0A319EBB4_ASPSB|nr:hypothetical protein BO78DRAFT_399435 [Aspergillus sclerotiicarbonarius CBS 121057]
MIAFPSPYPRAYKTQHHYPVESDQQQQQKKKRGKSPTQHPPSPKPTKRCISLAC